MKCRSARFLRQPHDVIRADAAARHDGDPACSAVDERLKQRFALHSRRLLPGGEDGVKAKPDRRFQRGKRIGAHVKRAVQRQRKPLRRLPARAKKRLVKPSVRIERADDGARSAEAFELRDLLKLLRLFFLRKQKVAEPGPDEHIDRHARLCRLTDQVRRGRRAADDQIGAKFQPVRAAAHSGADGFHRIHADLNQGSCHLLSSKGTGLQIFSQPCIRRISA